MKKLFTLLSLMALMLAGCSNEDVFTEGIVQEELDTTIKKVTITAPDFEMGGAKTRTIISKDMKTAWSSSDAIGIYPTNGEQIKFKIKTGAETSTAVFDAGDWGLKSTSTYAAYYPYQSGENTNEGKVIPLSYRGQKQLANNNTAHLGKYDYMAAAGQMPSGNSIGFQFMHLGSLVCIEIPAEESRTYTKITLSAQNAVFANTATLNVHDGTLTPTALSSTVSVELDNVRVEAGSTLKVWTMIAPTVSETGIMLLTVEDMSGKEYKNQGYINSQNFEAGKAYIIKPTTADEREVTYAKMVDGITFNKTIKSLANGGATMDLNNNDSNIKRIRFIKYNYSGGTSIKTSDSEYLVGVWYRDETITVSTDADKILLNKNSNDMFNGLVGLEEITGLDALDTRNVTSLSYMFSSCEKLGSIDLNNFNTENVTNMFYMFSNCKSLRSLDLSSFNTRNVTSMRDMFYRCHSLESLDLSNFCTSNITDMYGMFYDCFSLGSLDLSSFNTENVTSMQNMFYGCQSLVNLDLSHFRTSHVTNMASMFNGCKSLKGLDISYFNTENVTTMAYMFQNCHYLDYIVMGRNVDGVHESDFWIGSTTVRTNMLKNLGIYTTNKYWILNVPAADKSPTGGRLRSGDTGWDSYHVNIS